MIEFVFTCPHCEADDYNDLEIDDTDEIVNIKCANCGKFYKVKISVVIIVNK